MRLETKAFNQWNNGLPGGSDGKESACYVGDPCYAGDPRVGMISWRREWQPTPEFLFENPIDRGAWRATVYGSQKVTFDEVTVMIFFLKYIFIF